MNENSRRRDLEHILRHVPYYAGYSPGSSRLSLKIDWKRGEYTALALFDNTKFSDEARFQLRGKTLPNLTSRKLRIDFADSKLFDHTLRNQHDLDDKSDARDHSKNNNGSKRDRSSRSRSRESRKKRSSHDSPNNVETTAITTLRKVISSSPMSTAMAESNTRDLSLANKESDELEEGQMEDEPAAASKEKKPTRSVYTAPFSPPKIVLNDIVADVKLVGEAAKEPIVSDKVNGSHRKEEPCKSQSAESLLQAKGIFKISAFDTLVTSSRNE